MAFVTEPARKIPILDEAEVIVVGGGPSGFAAALAAARQGADTLLILRDSFLGGTLTTTTLGSICGLYSVTEDHLLEVSQGIGKELLGRMANQGWTGQPKRWLKTASLPFDPVGMKFIMDDMLSEGKVRFLFDAFVVSALTEEDHLKGVFIESKGGRHFIGGKVFVDASGDGDLAHFAGVPTEMTLADLQFPSAMFRFHGVDTELAAKYTRPEMTLLLEEAAKSGKYQLPRLTVGFHVTPRPGTVHCNVTKISRNGEPLNPLDPQDLSYGEMEGRRQIREYERFFQECVPGFEKAYVSDIGSRLGIRETRRVMGEYVLEAQDIFACRRFDDVIACSAWPVEMHEKGSGTRWEWVEPGNFYHIPYRCLWSRHCANLLVAGRCISTTHEAQASTRVAGVCFSVGHAAGLAAAQALDNQGLVETVNMKLLQKKLKEQGAFLG